MYKILTWYKNHKTDAIIGIIVLLLFPLYFITGPHMSRSEATNVIKHYSTSLYSYSDRDVIVEQDTLNKYPKLKQACEVVEIKMNYSIKILNN